MRRDEFAGDFDKAMKNDIGLHENKRKQKKNQEVKFR